MFKNGKKGKTNKKLRKGGEMIGFSFYIISNYYVCNYFSVCQNTNRNY